MTEQNELSAWIREEMMRRGGRVPFALYMEWALYHPEWGYYMRDQKKIGKEGDFYTSPSIHPVFAEVLADEMAKRADELGTESFDLIEFGAGEGRLAFDILARWQSVRPDLYERTLYRIVESSPSLRARQQERLREHRVIWQSEEEVCAGAPYAGIVLTNELLDAFPVHRIIRTAEGLQELYAAWDGEWFTMVPGPLSDPRIEDYLARYGAPLLIGQAAEAGLPGLDWYERAAGLLSQGAILTIDYGFEAQMLYHKSRLRGTLRGYFRHTVTDDPFARIGEQDLTADVNFTALQLRGEELGLKTLFFGSQSRYLLQSGILERLTDAFSPDPFRDPNVKRNMAIKQLILPGGIGDHFKVLVQGI